MEIIRVHDKALAPMLRLRWISEMVNGLDGYRMDVVRFLELAH